MSRQNYDPLQMFRQLEADLRLGASRAAQAIDFQPGLDMYETANALVVKLELAGVDPSRLDITLSGDDRMLSVRGERRESDPENEGRIRCYHLEIFFGGFQREIALPPEMRFDRDAIAANYRDGFLVISLPKRNSKRSIDVQAS